jgi:hypothetical protein
MTKDEKSSEHVIYVAFPSGNAGYIVGFDPTSVEFGMTNGLAVITIGKEIFAFDSIVVILTSIPSPSDPEGRFICYNPRAQQTLPEYSLEWLSDNPEWGIEAGLKQILDVLYGVNRHRDKIIDIRKSVFNLTDEFEVMSTGNQTVH